MARGQPGGSQRLILLADANVLMDLGYVGGLKVLAQLGRTEVLSTVLLECQHAKQPNLLAQIIAAGIVEVEVQRGLLESALAYTEQDENLSFQDCQCLLYARNGGRTLITGDNRLRAAAGRERVEVHGSVWLVEQAQQQQLVANEVLCSWLAQWPLQGRRLPHTEVARLRVLLGCS